VCARIGIEDIVERATLQAWNTAGVTPVHRPMARTILFAVILAACGSAGTTPDEPKLAAAPAATPASAPSTKQADREAASKAAVAALIGTTPPEWQAERWMSSPPLTLAKLRGQVVMVRWWTSGCPFCSTTAPTLRQFASTYGPRGLNVIGLYHWKEDTAFDPKVYEETAKKYQFTFPVAFDPEWRTLESWLKNAKGEAVSTGWTSITFVLDKQGVIRHVHPGGSYVEGEPAYDEMRAVIERLLAE
jgi:peroxiredoxin